jgi:hypothetical protein
MMCPPQVHHPRGPLISRVLRVERPINRVHHREPRPINRDLHRARRINKGHRNSSRPINRALRIREDTLLNPNNRRSSKTMPVRWFRRQEADRVRIQAHPLTQVLLLRRTAVLKDGRGSHRHSSSSSPTGSKPIRRRAFKVYPLVARLLCLSSTSESGRCKRCLHLRQKVNSP